MLVLGCGGSVLVSECMSCCVSLCAWGSVGMCVFGIGIWCGFTLVNYGSV